MERVFAQVGLAREHVEHKLISALQDMQEEEALRVFDQFGNGDMARIRNKGAYLWGIVRNVQSGSRSSKSEGRYSGLDSSAPTVDGDMKLLWPEEEQVLGELELHVGEMEEKEFKFDNHTCNVPPAESLYSDASFALTDFAATQTSLNAMRAQTSGVESTDWQRHLVSTSLTGRLLGYVKSKVHPEMFSTGWLKAYELICAYPLVPSTAQKEGTLRSLHLCESGAHVSALNHYLKTNSTGVAWEWTAHSFSFTPSVREGGAEERPSAVVERFIKDTAEHWLPVVNGSNDIRRRANVEAVWQIAKERETFHLITADGYIVAADGYSTGEAAEKAESEATLAPLVLSEVVAGLGALAMGGSMVVRAGTLLEHTSIGLLYLLNGTFASVTVVRPVAAAACECEVFVVCTGFKGVGQSHLDKLLSAVGTTKFQKDGLEQAMMPKSFISEAWLGQLRKCTELFVRLQCSMLEREIRLFNKHLVQAEKQEIFHTRDKAALHWHARFGCRPLNSVHDRITRDGLSSMSMSSSQMSAGGRIWHSIRGRFADVKHAGQSQAAKRPAGDSGGLRLEHQEL